MATMTPAAALRDTRAEAANPMTRSASVQKEKTSIDDRTE
jgi:hypothetical protein